MTDVPLIPRKPRKVSVSLRMDKDIDAAYHAMAAAAGVSKSSLMGLDLRHMITLRKEQGSTKRRKRAA